MAAYVVMSGDWYLRGSVWAGSIERATIYPTQEQARAALAKARKFMKPSAFKAARITEVPS